MYTRQAKRNYLNLGSLLQNLLEGHQSEAAMIHIVVI